MKALGDMILNIVYDVYSNVLSLFSYLFFGDLLDSKEVLKLLQKWIISCVKSIAQMQCWQQFLHVIGRLLKFEKYTGYAFK